MNYGYWIINLHLETFSGPHYQFTHFDFISERVIPKKRIPPQFYVYRQPSITSTANSTPIEISPNGVGEAPLRLAFFYLGIAQMAIAPPLRTQTGTLGHFFPGQFERLCQITVLRVYKCHKESWQALNPLLTKENT